MSSIWKKYFNQLQSGDIKTLARCISLVENEVTGYEELLENLPSLSIPVIGITGPPGAGKSSLTECLIEKIVLQNKKVGVLCVDPSSPFNLGALLGDRIRMSKWYNHPDVFIRSLASRGSLGGLHPKIIEITELLKATGFDYIIIETVGVGQSEIEIAGLSDATIVVFVPEAGDEIQTMKSGIMEIADIFVVNKSDRPDADIFTKNLLMILSPSFHQKEIVPVIKTNALTKEGTDELFDAIVETVHRTAFNNKKYLLLAEKIFYLIQQKRMKDIDKIFLKNTIEKAGTDFNLFKFLKTID